MSIRLLYPSGLCIPVPGCQESVWEPSARTMSRQGSLRRPCQVAAAVEDAAAVGYRHFDCASVYANEHEIGYALEQVVRRHLEREELWITSKLWNDKHGENDVIASCRKSLTDLRLSYLDLYLVHWPFPNFHP